MTSLIFISQCYKISEKLSIEATKCPQHFQPTCCAQGGFPATKYLGRAIFSDLITITTIVLDCWSMSAAYGSGEGCCLPKTKSQMFIAVEKTAVQDKDFSITFLGLWHPL